MRGLHLHQVRAGRHGASATTRSRTPRRSSTTCSASLPSPISAATTSPMSTQSDFSNTALGRGIQEGKTDAVSKGLTRGRAEDGAARPAASRRVSPAARARRRAGRAALGRLDIAFIRSPTCDGAGAGRSPEQPRSRSPSSATTRSGRRNWPRTSPSRKTRPTARLRRGRSPARLFTDAAAREAAEAKALAAERRQQALMQGYTGNMCSECQNFTMVRNGTCEKCDTCGSTSGCS